jgi:predicted DNA repair protein MutK
VITLGTVASEPFATRVVVLSAISVIMTVGVYGLVAGIVKLDDSGLALSKGAGSTGRAVGAAILRTAPMLMKALSFLGTAAMFLVGGGIITHGIAPLHHFIEDVGARLQTFPAGGLLETLTSMALNGLAGVIAGGVVVGVVAGGKRIFARRPAR